MNLDKKKVPVILMVLFLALSLSCGEGAAAAGDSGEAGDPLPVFHFVPGARAWGMGGAGVALPGDATSCHRNPAGLVDLMRGEGGVMYTRFYPGYDTSFNYASIILPSVRNGSASRGAMGFTMVRLVTTGIPLVGEGRNVVGEFESAQTGLMVSYGRSLSANLALGLTMKYGYHSLYEGSGRAVSLDCGVLYRVGERGAIGVVLRDPISTGMRWSTGYREDLPLRVEAGVAYELKGRNVTIAADFDFRLGQLMAGLKWRVTRVLDLRFGANTGGAITAGVGLDMGDYYVDYAFVSHSDLGGSHRISSGIRF